LLAQHAFGRVEEKGGSFEKAAARYKEANEKRSDTNGVKD
jgi:hypothetical protein